jgi:K+-sensing histidine kinase KdpD
MDRNSVPHVLVIDDELSICTGVCGLLELEGIKASYVLSADDGLGYIEKNPGVDIVLLDVNLGAGLNGMEVLPLIKERNRYVQVVMFTSQDRLEVGLICMKRGALDFMTKPFNLKAFFRIAASGIEKKRLEQVKDLYIDMIIHDLKNPLQCVSGAIEILKDTVGEMTSIQKRLFETAENGAQRLQMMIGNILAVTTFEKGMISARWECFSVREQVENALQLFNPVEITFNGEIPDSVCTDKDLFIRVLSNIVANASRFAMPGTAVRVDIEYQQDGYLLTSITNEGSFIPDEYREVVFDKFLGVNKSASAIRGQNFGLGLTFSKMAVDVLGGKIWIEGDSDIPQTTFKFTVKIHDSVPYKQSKNKVSVTLNKDF